MKLIVSLKRLDQVFFCTAYIHAGVHAGVHAGGTCRGYMQGVHAGVHAGGTWRGTCRGMHATHTHAPLKNSHTHQYISPLGILAWNSAAQWVLTMFNCKSDIALVNTEHLHQTRHYSSEPFPLQASLLSLVSAWRD